MAYDEGLTWRIRQLLEEIPELVEKKMFGGVGFILMGNMACGVNGSDLIVRVGPAGYQQALALPHTRVFDLTGRPISGWIVVEADGVADDALLDAWVQRGVDFARSLPPK
jgi:TfoX/Sxy family transcriptional regulator of competence genes